MKTRVVAATLLLLAVSTPLRAIDPKIRVRLTEDNLFTGENAKVKIKAATSGYLVVLRLDTEGRVRVLFPVDPTDNAAIKGGKEWEVRSRGDRDAFVATEHTGSGLILAARADAPFNFNEFTANQRWNPAAFITDKPNPDGEALLLSMIDRMGGAHYDYDAVPYHVGAPLPRSYYGNRYRPHSAVFYDPWYPVGSYAPWSYYGPAFGFGFGYGPYVPTFGYPIRVGRRR